MDKLLSPGKHIIVQGITGTHGAFHTEHMLKSGINVVAGTSNSHVGQKIHALPVYASIHDLQQDYTVDSSIVFVPARFAKDALLEAIEATIPLIICITEGIPVHDMIIIRERLTNSSSLLIGPNCPGILLPNQGTLGIIPPQIGLPGSIAIVSRSGTLTYEATAGLSARNLGQKYVIGIGGDPIHGAGFIECLELFMADPEVSSIVLIGEIGGSDEHIAAAWLNKHASKPVFAYVAGQQAPPNVQLGHAGAILGSSEESATAKTMALQAAGAFVFDSITKLVAAVK